MMLGSRVSSRWGMSRVVLNPSGLGTHIFPWSLIQDSLSYNQAHLFLKNGLVKHTLNVMTFLKDK